MDDNNNNNNNGNNTTTTNNVLNRVRTVVLHTSFLRAWLGAQIKLRGIKFVHAFYRNIFKKDKPSM